MLLEEIKQCIHPDIQLFLDDQEIGYIHGTAEKADYYALTHKISNKSFKQSSSYIYIYIYNIFIRTFKKYNIIKTNTYKCSG